MQSVVRPDRVVGMVYIYFIETALRARVSQVCATFLVRCAVGGVLVCACS